MFAKLRQRWKDARTIMALSLDAERRALAEGQRHPGAEHYMLAALDLPDGSARRAFARVGVDPEAYRAALANRHTVALNAMGIAAAVDGMPGAPVADTGRPSAEGSGQGDVPAAALHAARASDTDRAPDAAGVSAAAAGTGLAPSALFDAQPSGQALLQSLPELQRRLPAPLCGAHVLLAAATMAHSTAGRAFRAIGIDPQALGRAAEVELRAAMPA